MGKVISITINKSSKFEDTEACIDLAAEAAIDEGMSLKQFINYCLDNYRKHSRKTK